MQRNNIDWNRKNLGHKICNWLDIEAILAIN